MRRIGARPPTPFDQPGCYQPLHHHCQQTHLPDPLRPRNSHSTECLNPVGQLQPQAVFPVDPAPHRQGLAFNGIRCLSMTSRAPVMSPGARTSSGGGLRTARFLLVVSHERLTWQER
jgi:hypothetical protein